MNFTTEQVSKTHVIVLLDYGYFTKLQALLDTASKNLDIDKSEVLETITVKFSDGLEADIKVVACTVTIKNNRLGLRASSSASKIGLTEVGDGILGEYKFCVDDKTYVVEVRLQGAYDTLYRLREHRVCYNDIPQANAIKLLPLLYHCIRRAEEEIADLVHYQEERNGNADESTCEVHVELREMLEALEEIVE